MIELPPPLWLPSTPAIIRPAPAIRKASVLPGLFPAAVAAGVKPADVVFAAASSNSSSPLNNFSKTNQGFGAEDPSRQIIVLVFGYNANLVSDTNFTTSVTVGGVGAIRKVAPSSKGIGHFTAWITPRADSGGPTGTSGTIQVSRSTGNGYNTVGFAAFAAYNLRDSDPIESYSTTGQSPSASGTLALRAGGILTAFAQADVSTEITWAGADEVYDAAGGVNGSQRFAAALLSKTSATVAHAISADSADSSDAMIAVSWR